MICTPSPRRPSTTFASHLQRRPQQTPAAVQTPSRPSSTASHTASLSTPFISLHSPAPSMTSSQRLPPLDFGEQASESSEEPNTSSDDDEENDDGSIYSLPSPTTPAPRRISSNLAFSSSSRNSNRRSGPSKPSARTPRIAPPRFHTSPVRPPQTPDQSEEWRNHGGAESMTRLSLHDARRDPPKENALPSSSPSHDRRRTPSSALRISSRYRRGATTSLLDPSNSPTARASAALFESPAHAGLVFHGKPVVPDSPSNPFADKKRFAPLHILKHFSQETVNAPRSSSPEHFTFGQNRTSSPFVSQPSPSRSSSPSAYSLSHSTSSTSNASTRSLDDDEAESTGSAKRPRLSTKFKPRTSIASTFGNDDSDDADTSFGSSSSFGNPIHSAVSPVVVAEEESPFSLVTPSSEPSTSSGWPTVDVAIKRSSRKAGTESIDPDEMIFHMAQTHEQEELANAKPTIPDTPMKRHPPKPRAWQSVGKPWGSTSHFEGPNFGGAPRKSLPVRMPNFSEVPDSPDSDRSPSKPVFGLQVRQEASRRKSYGGLVTIRDTESSSAAPPVPQAPSLLRNSLLRQASSGAASVASDISSVSSDGTLTPTKTGPPSAWKAESLVLTDSSNVVRSHDKPSIPASPWAASEVPPTPFTKRPSLAVLRGVPGTKIPALPIGQEAPHPAFVLPKATKPAPGPVKSFFNNRPSLQNGSTPVRSAPRRESQPVRPLPALGWGTPSVRPPSLFSGSDHESGASKRSLGFGLGSASVRRPRSSMRLGMAVMDDNQGNEIVMERPGRFERDFIRPSKGPGVLGKGTFGQVFRVQEKGVPSDRVYAVKRSKPYEGIRHRSRLLEEVEALRHLTRASGSCRSTPSTHRITQGHDNVLHFIDAWEQDQTLYIQTELCEFGSLASFLAEYGKLNDQGLDEARLWKVLAEVASGLHHIHHNGVLHLDLKPANIFVTIEGRLRIGDFGMATRWPRKDSESSVAGSGFEREGDREYLAAEVLKGKYGPAADIFSFGMIMLEAAANIVVPTNGDAWHRLRQDDFSEVSLDGLSSVLAKTIQNMMASSYHSRPTIDSLTTLDHVLRTRAIMKRHRVGLMEGTGKIFKASAFASESPSILVEVLGPEVAATLENHMDTSF